MSRLERRRGTVRNRESDGFISRLLSRLLTRFFASGVLMYTKFQGCRGGVCHIAACLPYSDDNLCG
jgi:hypothetical protein